MDTLKIKNLRCSAHIGCEAAERATAQQLLVTAALQLDTREAAAEDQLEKTVNYALLSKQLMQICEAARCQLIETLAQQLADACLELPKVAEATIEIRKPAGVKHADYASITITRTK